MKKIIGGIRYDTEKAVEIGSASHLYASDFHHWEATLMKSPRSDRYFLAGHGGAMSRFGQSVGRNKWGSGEDIIPMDKEDALAWAEMHLAPQIVEDFFNDIIKDA
jgi:hypothetical protein